MENQTQPEAIETNQTQNQTQGAEVIMENQTKETTKKVKTTSKKVNKTDEAIETNQTQTQGAETIMTNQAKETKTNQPKVAELSVADQLKTITKKSKPLSKEGLEKEDKATMMLSDSELEAVDQTILDKAMQNQTLTELIKRGANLTLLKELTKYPESIIKAYITKIYNNGKDKRDLTLAKLYLVRRSNLSSIQARTNLPKVQEFMKERFFKQEPTADLAEKFGLKASILTELRKTCPKEAQSRNAHKSEPIDDDKVAEFVSLYNDGVGCNDLSEYLEITQQRGRTLLQDLKADKYTEYSFNEETKLFTKSTQEAVAA